MTDEQPPSVNRRVLVIDDNESIHEDVRKILLEDADRAELAKVASAMLGTDHESVRRVEFEIDSALSGEEGLRLVERAVAEGRPYSMALVDMRMPPGWDGVETIERLWAVDANLQVVICTAHSDYTWEETIARLGLSDQLLILRKPFEPVEIRQLAYALTEKWSLARRVEKQLSALEGAMEDRMDELRSANLQLQTANRDLETQVAKRSAAEAMLRHEAYHDSLTNLPNRAMLEQRLQECIDRADAEESYGFALLFLDIDNFKTLNDTFGHAVGDALLVHVAARLTHCVRDGDAVSLADQHTTARLGGDEFVILLDGIHSSEEAIAVADRIQASVAKPIHADGHEAVVSTSIGISVCRHGGKSAGDLLREGDSAMYRAKCAGKAQHAIFDDRMHEELSARVRMENELRGAIERDELSLRYQPIVELESGRTVGFEALVRWTSPTSGPLAPNAWIQAAEDIGLIIDVGRWVLVEACTQLAEWRAAFPGRDLSMNVNLSFRQLLEADFVDEVQALLARFDLEPRHLRFEFTEAALMDNLAPLRPVLDRLRAMGIELCLDDFGTGHSSLSALRSFPMDVIKIDRAFLISSGESRECAAVNHAIITLAHNLDMRVVAEGVELPEQLAQLQALECNYAQGYLFSRPVEASVARRMIDDGKGAGWSDGRSVA